MRVDDPAVVMALTQLLNRVPAQAHVWPMSPSRFATRLALLCKMVIGPASGVLPSSLRTGGATWFFLSSGESLDRLLWRGSWRDARVLGSYIQECTAALPHARLPRADAARVELLAFLFP